MFHAPNTADPLYRGRVRMVSAFEKDKIEKNSLYFPG